MPRVSFQSEIADQGVVLRMLQRGLIGARRPIPAAQWAEAGGDMAFAAIANVLATVEANDGRAVIHDDGVLLSHPAAAALSEAHCAALQLPAAAPFALSIETNKLITDPAFSIRASWVEGGNRPAYAERCGAFLRRGGDAYRIPDPLYSIAEAVDMFRKADSTDDGNRFAALARLQELFPSEELNQLRLDGYVRRFRVLHATSFSLRLETGDQSFQFAPVLFGRRITQRVTAETDAIVSEAESLLTPHQQDIFSRHRFSEHQSARDRYAIDAGVYVYLDPSLKDALSVVRKVQLSGADARRRFAKSPQLFLREELRNSVDEAALETLFIETEQYSERVVDVGAWAPPILPWIKREPNTWLPERFGIQIGEKHIVLTSEDLAPLRQAVETAIASGTPDVSFGEHKIPATAQTLQALSSLVGEVKPAAKDDQVQRRDVGETKASKQVLIVGENFEQLDFARARTPRASSVEPKIPEGIRPSLKPHQQAGLLHLQESWRAGVPGVLLADDMGLGKTLQALTFLLWLREAVPSVASPRRPKGPFLIVAPTGLLANWLAEHDRHLFEPGLGEVCKAYGSHLSTLKTGRSPDVVTGAPALSVDRILASDWVLTTYETLRDYHMSFAAVPFACAVFDEMQKVKNPGSLNTRAAKTVNADFTLGMTGTPIENQLEDLWSIMDIVTPGRLGDLKGFSATFRGDDEQSLQNLRAATLDGTSDAPAPVLRRMKADHLQGLPERRLHVRRRMMPEAQATAYEAAVARAKGDAPGPMLETLHTLRGISLHPVWPNFGSLDDPDGYISQSARLTETFTILDEISAKGEKALIFLESLDMQDQLALMIKRRYGLAELPMQINGEVSGERRQKAVDRFQEKGRGFDVMILSPKAGGVGLTLTAANHVIHLSRWWNPAVEDQCTDRVYRIGQDRTVHVYYPMAIHPDMGDGSFDALLQQLLDRKRALGRRMLIPPVDARKDEAWFSEYLSRPKSAVERLSLDELDRMEPTRFERWALQSVTRLGYVADRTPKSHDAGCDGLLIHQSTGARVAIQCKHKQDPTAYCTDEAVDDLLRAQSSYSEDAIKLVALTNAASFSPKARLRATRHGIRLIARKDLAEWPPRDL